MFDDLAVLTDGGLLVAMSESQRVERAAAARRIVAAGVFAVRREAGPGTKTEMWCVEDWDVAAAEVGAELGVSRFRAKADLALGYALVTRLLKVAQRFLAGDLDPRVVTAIDNRTLSVQDPDILARLDEILAEKAADWNALSREKLNDVIDWLVIELDPEARRVPRERHHDRHIDITGDKDGLSDVSGSLPTVDAEILDKRLDQTADTVCRNDPRTKAQRRTDALFALVDGLTTLPCACGGAECAAGDEPAATPSQVIVHVLAEQSTVTGQGDKPGYVLGQGPIAASTVHELIRSGRAKTRPVATADALDAEPRYRPSRKLTDFLLCRDMICRFPGCNKPVDECDTDHTIPWPYGRTHPSNTKPYCRHHHLLKTFWSGPGGFQDIQHPDGTIEFTSPAVGGTEPGRWEHCSFRSWRRRPADMCRSASRHRRQAPKAPTCHGGNAAGQPTAPLASPGSAVSTGRASNRCRRRRSDSSPLSVCNVPLSGIYMPDSGKGLSNGHQKNGYDAGGAGRCARAVRGDGSGPCAGRRRGHRGADDQRQQRDARSMY